MKKEKIKKFLKSKVGACIITGLIAFNVGAMMMASDTSSPSTTEVNSLKTSLSEKEEEIERLQAKVDEAKPYFDMNAEEQAKLEEQAKKEKEEREAREKAEAEANAQAEIAAKTVQLSSGNYVAGTDFEAGVYDIVALSGSGNVYSDNAYRGGINAVMGSQDKIDEANSMGMTDFYKLEYKNIKLSKGVTLKIDGPTIKLVPVK